MKKIKMYDTNVLLQSPEVVQRDPEGCCIPLKVIEELDAQKKRNDELGFKARRAVRILEKSMSDGQLNVISSSPENLPPDLSFSDADNQILSAVLKISRKPDVEVTFYSNDLNMRIKSNSVGVTCHEFIREGEVATGAADLEIEYTGVSSYVVPDSFINEFYEDQGCVFLPKNGTELFPNQFLVLTSDSDPKKTALARFTSWNDSVTPVPNYELNRNWALKPRNKEQSFAMSLLMDPEVKVVTMIGRAGGGKSLLAIAAALEQIFDQGSPYRKILVTRPIQPMGNDIGFLPGSKEEKLIPWIQPIRDNLEVLTKGNKEVVDVWFEKGKIEMEAPTFIRGRSLSNCIMIVDEVQNASLHELKTILTRVGENTKIILTGDIDQIDNSSLNKYTNGLVQVVEKFKPYKLAGHITLLKGERSEVATLASRIL